MKEIIITIGVLMGMTSTPDDKIILNETINNIQDMKEWMIEDRNNGVIPPEYADYYIQWLNESEVKLIQITD
jgi:hypothetical protein